MSKELDSVLGAEENFFDEDSKPSPCRQITVDKENNLIILKLDGVELFKQSISKLDNEIEDQFLNFILDAWRNEKTEVLKTELKMGVSQ